MKIDSKLGQVNEFSISHIDFSTIHLVLELDVSLIYPLDYSLISVRGWILFIFAKSKCYLCILASLSSWCITDAQKKIVDTSNTLCTCYMNTAL